MQSPLKNLTEDLILKRKKITFIFIFKPSL